MKFEKRRPTGRDAKGIRANIFTILSLVAVLFYVCVARMVYSPLLPSIERDLQLNHTQGASFFLLMTIGYTLMNVLSGFVASRLSHKSTIFLSLLSVTSATVLVAASPSLALIRVGLVAVGAGAGLYPPSGVAMATALVDIGNEGKVLSIHEFGPNLAFVMAPFIVRLFLPYLGWRSCLVLISVLGLVIGALFMAFGRGGHWSGEAPGLHNARQILSLPSFWIAAGLMALGTGASTGLYSIIPTYLVFERGLDQRLVNTIVGTCRIISLISLSFAGWLADRFGATRIVSIILFLAGIFTAALSFRSQAILVVAVFIQPILSVCFTPAILTVLSRIAPRRLQSLTVSFVLPIGYGFGAGVLPVLLGWLGDNASFALGFLLYGLLMIVGSIVPFLLTPRHGD